jgi:hypothetical protein
LKDSLKEAPSMQNKGRKKPEAKVVRIELMKDKNANFRDFC